MVDRQNIQYRGWTIVPVAVPQPDGKWSACCEIEAIDAVEKSTFHGALDVIVRARKEDALAAAVDGAMRHIDAIIADPLWNHPPR